MRRSILICLFLVFSINTFADCPEFKVSLENSKILGNSQNQFELQAVTLNGVFNSAYYVDELTLVYFEPSLLPSYIIGCGNIDSETGKISGSFDFDGTEVQANTTELKKYGISYIFVSQHSSSSVELIDDGTSLLFSSQGIIYFGSGEAPLVTYLFRWDDASQRYIFSEKTSVLESEESIKKMEISIALDDFGTLEQQLSEFEFDDGFDPNYKKLPKEFSKKLWTAVHKKALALYKKGNKLEAAQLVTMILDNKPASIPNELNEYYSDEVTKFYGYNYATEALYENSKLLTSISDCAFFLEQSDLELEKAASVFIAIQRDYPKRVVTYLNLADASWKLKRFDSAKENYQTYVDMLLAKDKRKAIPKYVYKRLDHLKREGENKEKKLSIDTSLLFPFGMNLSAFTKGVVGESGGGDCWGTARKYTKNKTEISTHNFDCDIWGFHNKYFLLKNGKVVRAHQKDGENLSTAETEFAARVLIEKVFDFSVKPYVQYVRIDTIHDFETKQLQSDFKKSEIEDSEAVYVQLMAQYSEIWENSQKNEGEIILSEDSLGTYRLEKGMQVDLYMLREVFYDFEVSKNIGEQDGPNYNYFTIGNEAQIATPDVTKETLFQVLIPEKSSIVDTYGISIGTSIYEVVEKRTNLNISTEHYRVYLYKEGSHIAYEMSLGDYKGPDKDEYTFDDIKNAKVISIIWE